MPRIQAFYGLLVATLMGVCLLVAACVSQRALRLVIGVLIVMSLIVCAAIAIRGFFRWLSKRDLFAPWIGFPIAYIIWFGFACLFIQFGEGSEEPPYAVAILGLVCYLMGVGVARLRWNSATHVPTGAFRSEWDMSLCGKVTMLVAAIAFAAYVLIAIQLGIPGLHAGAGEIRLNLINYGKSQSVFVYGTQLVIILLACKLWSEEGDKKSRWGIWLAIAVASLLLLTLGSRGNLLTPISAIFIARHYLRQKTPLLPALSIAAAVFVVASLVGWARDMAIYSSYKGEDLQFNIASLIFLYQYITTTVTTLSQIMAEIPRHVPFQHGVLSFGALASVLPGHHESSDMFFRRILGSEFVGAGQPATLLGPMYGDFGYAGVVVQMFGLGVFYVWIYRWMLEGATVYRAFMYAWISQVILYSLFGSLLTYIGALLIPIAWVSINSTLRVRPTAFQPGAAS